MGSGHISDGGPAGPPFVFAGIRVNAQVHYRMTRRWALEEGFTEPEAEIIALADVAVDSDLPGRRWSNKRYHFMWLGARRIARTWLEEAVRTGDLTLLGKALHCEQDAVSHGHLGHLLHWPGIDIWERRGLRARARIESVSRALMREYQARSGS